VLENVKEKTVNGKPLSSNGNPLPFVKTICEKQGITICGTYF
jgi:hypothetical protein